MKIAFLYAFWLGENWSTPIGFRQEFERQGHDVSDWNLYHHGGEIRKKGEIRRYSTEGLNNLYCAIRSNIYHPDVIFHMDYGMFDAPPLDKMHIPDCVWVMESGDDPQAYAQNSQKAHKFHIVHSPDYQSVERYKEAGINAHWLTHCADTSIFYPREHIETKYDCVTTCGPRGGGVTEQIQKALGTAFNNERWFWGEEHAERLNMGKMVFQCSQHKEITRRIFEGMACGKLMITDRLPEHTHLQDLLVEGEDIVYYDNADDAIDKIRYYAQNDEERERIARNGLNKVLEHHTTAVRVEYLMNEIERYKTR